ncbi:MAG: GNAT family N-acetyltransferase [Gammaproteobacteria bacterium]
MNLRPGTPDDVAALDAIALAAKAHWGYSTEQLQAWDADLRVRQESLACWPICVAELDGRPIGFAQLATDRHPWELEALWVRPDHMGKGVGKALVLWASRVAAANGQAELAIDSDPNAANFYRAQGARLVGVVPAPISCDPLRVRPQLRLVASAA